MKDERSARTAGPKSDLDILVVEPAVESRAEEAIRLRRVLRGLRLTADLLVITDRDLDEWRDVRGSIIHAALSDSRLLASWWQARSTWRGSFSGSLETIMAQQVHGRQRCVQ